MKAPTGPAREPATTKTMHLRPFAALTIATALASCTAVPERTSTELDLAAPWVLEQPASKFLAIHGGAPGSVTRPIYQTRNVAQVFHPVGTASGAATGASQRVPTQR